MDRTGNDPWSSDQEFDSDATNQRVCASTGGTWQQRIHFCQRLPRLQPMLDPLTAFPNNAENAPAQSPSLGSLLLSPAGTLAGPFPQPRTRPSLGGIGKKIGAGLLCIAAGAILAQTLADATTKADTKDGVMVFYHGTYNDNARSIIVGGVQDGFTVNQAMGNGFYTFRLEDLAEDWAITRTPIGKRPAVLRLTIPESTYKTLQKQGLVEEGAWVAFAGAPATPGITQVVFRPGAYGILNSLTVLKEWKQRQYPSRTWSAYQTGP